MQKDKDHQYKHVNRLETNYKAEALAAGVIEAGREAERTLIVRQKGSKQHISKDIEHVLTSFSQQDLMEYLYIYTNRTGIYDSIPENIFHQPYNTARKKSQEDVIEEIRRHRTEEFYARRFFQPFEMVVDQLLIDVQLYERRFDKKNFHDNLKNILSDFWPVLQDMTLRQAVFFIRIMPLAHRLHTDYALMGKLLSVIMEVPIKVTLGELATFKVNRSIKLESGKWKLGVNSIVGKSFKDGSRNVKITIGEASPEDIRYFYEGFKGRTILDGILHKFLPVTMPIVYEYKTFPKQAHFKLSSKNHKCYLGINTRL